MHVEIDNEDFEVYLCDEHAESSTMVQVKKKVKEIKDKLRNAIELAIDLGITIPEIKLDSGEMPNFDIVSPSKPEPEPEPKISKSTEPEQKLSPEETQSQKVIKRDAVPVKLSEKETINSDTIIEMQEIEVKNGKVSIPKHSEGEAGSTDIRIMNTNDKIIQDRAKLIKNQADQGRDVGYSKDCIMCKGTGTHPITKEECPKCKGSGMMLV